MTASRRFILMRFSISTGLDILKPDAYTKIIFLPRRINIRREISFERIKWNENHKIYISIPLPNCQDSLRKTIQFFTLIESIVTQSSKLIEKGSSWDFKNNRILRLFYVFIHSDHALKYDFINPVCVWSSNLQKGPLLNFLG
jgi:hypothetical protein